MNNFPSEKDDDWDYKTVLRIEPYAIYAHEGQSYILSIRRRLLNMSKNVVDDSWVNICILDIIIFICIENKYHFITLFVSKALRFILIFGVKKGAHSSVGK